MKTIRDTPELASKHLFTCVGGLAGKDFGKVLKKMVAKKTCNETKMFHGDCLRVMSEMPDNNVHLILTDPPYFLNGLSNNWSVEKVQESRAKAGIVGGLPVGMKFDKNQGLELQKFMTKVSEHAIRVLRPGGFFVSFAAPRLYHRMAVALEDTGFEIRDMYAWHYQGSAQQKAFTLDHFVRKMNIPKKEQDQIIRSMQGRKTPQLRPQFEPMVIAQKPKQGTFIENWRKWDTGLIDVKSVKINGQSPSTVMHVEKPHKKKYNCHLTVKPVPLMEALVKIFTTEGQIVLDPFAGSGSTLLAAREAERNSIGIEVNKKYYDIAIQRLGN